MNQEYNKIAVKNYWNKATCGTEFIYLPKFSKAYFEAIENFRYTMEPEIFSFAQFTRWSGKKILEVGIGAGTDFLQWIRAGAECYGIDLTEESITHMQYRMNMYNLTATEVHTADAENLPYFSNSFDLVYSWGVIHHSPKTKTCLSEIIRVTKPGGTIKIMIYHRYSLFALYQWIRFALLKGKPWISITETLEKYQESPGTKAYTIKEAKKMITSFPVTIISIATPVTKHDLLIYKTAPFRFFAYLLATILGWKQCGWFMMIELKKHAILSESK